MFAIEMGLGSVSKVMVSLPASPAIWGGEERAGAPGAAVDAAR